MTGAQVEGVNPDDCGLVCPEFVVGAGAVGLGVGLEVGLGVGGGVT